MAVVCTDHRAENHDVVQFLRDGQEGYLHVDKTAYLHFFVRQEGNMCFLSRPRRFGKTLTVSTLEAIFQGRRKLFKGLP
ncbi:MAG: AAA family ATPase [Sphaerochaetaceae bacterium]|nr:AAA family ATPase [Sphaerochaetaceae bacterium]